MGSKRKTARVGDFERVDTEHGSEVYLLPTTKFKSRLIRIHFRAPLGPGNAAWALVPSLLRRGSQHHPTLVEVSRALESLFGAAWGSSTYKAGTDLTLAFRLDVVDGRFLPAPQELLEPALDLMREFLMEPHLVDGRFLPDVFLQERRNLEREIEAQFNDKMSYAFQRLLTEMFPGDSYGHPVTGTLEEAAALTAEQVLEAWQAMVKELPARVYAVGDLNQDQLVDWMERYLPFPGRPAAAAAAVPPAEQPCREVVEQQSVSQSKLLIGHHIDLVDLTERQFDALRVFAQIFGGGFQSRLFQTVREKHSLAYHVSAGVDRIKGFLYVSCGIDAGHREAVLEHVEKELDSLRSAPPSDAELELARGLLRTSSRSMGDVASGMVDVLESGLASGFVRPLEGLCAALEAVTPQDVWEVAQRIGPVQLVYCLEGESRHGTA